MTSTEPQPSVKAEPEPLEGETICFPGAFKLAGVTDSNVSNASSHMDKLSNYRNQSPEVATWSSSLHLIRHLLARPCYNLGLHIDRLGAEVAALPAAKKAKRKTRSGRQASTVSGAAKMAAATLADTDIKAESGEPPAEKPKKRRRKSEAVTNGTLKVSSVL